MCGSRGEDFIVIVIVIIVETIQVRKEEGSYAFFMEAASIEYNMQQYCDLRWLLMIICFGDNRRMLNDNIKQATWWPLG